MDILLSAILGELTNKSMNFLISKISKPATRDLEDNLQKGLLRAQIITEEAMGRRHVTSHAMLLQLDKLREAIHQGYYTLDNFRYRSHNKDDAKNQVLSHSSPLPKINSLKGFCSSSRNTQIFDQMEKSLDNLSSMIIDVKELVEFLSGCPCMYRQPYSMHILLGNCMFGRQREVELVINFLLHTQPREKLSVLPIVGPGKSGKSTLVSHVCKDDRVQGHFSEIFFSHDRALAGDELELATFIEGCAMKHQSQPSQFNKERRLLFVIELVGDLNEDAWNILYSASKRCLPRGSKVIVTSRSQKIINFGTTQALKLKHLSREAYWYFFKTLTFGSTDPAMDPRFAYLAMEIANVNDGTLFRASITARLLRENFDIYFWCKVLAFLRLIQKSVSRYDEHPFNLSDLGRPVRFRISKPSKDFLIYHHDHQLSSEEEVPKIKITDVIFENVKPHGKFDALTWRSPIPPYRSYVSTCEICEQKTTAIKRKRSMRDKVTLS